MVLFTIASVLSLSLGLALAQSSTISPLARPCPGRVNDTNIVCMNRYASSMPPSFERQSSTGGAFSPNDTFVKTQVPSDPSFNLVKNATLVMFDERGDQILGSSPRLDCVFASRNDSIHEGPVYIYLAQTLGDDGFHVAQNGYLIAAAEGGGVTVLSEYDEMLLRIETGFTFAGPKRKNLWVFGEGEIARVT
ncbi:hypothetical protein E4T38_08873 [Aureobasidium subglaciale]|nr:hypothetical protein E4T38_08873 [Aureobasidium subglaciale]KAI5214752.1 hypothetical protein E4T40_08830 [Aureobasidium subglaciale]KAI5217678.1 hypothetical protein E4T41_08740 [Aureobasidium subglaciale]KAI5255381.1 hypothetical protein E4T46_08774 [Aureobasidium subglaciale]